MDQLKKALAWLKEQHFWVLTALLALIGVGAWYTASSAINEDTVKNEGTIKQAFTTSHGMAGQTSIPNPEITERQQQEVQKRAQAVLQLWQQLYDRQRTEVLKWPEEALTQRFVDTVEKLKFGSEIPADLRPDYQNYIAKHFSRLPAIIKAQEIVGAAGGFGGRGRGIVAPPVDAASSSSAGYVCDWLDQDDVRSSLIFPQTPSSLRIWVTQEDLWAYTTLLNAIAATNENVGADRPDNAAISIVDVLDVGRSAAAESRTGRINLPAGLASAAMSDAGARAAATIARGVDTVASAEDEQAALLSGRYVDVDGNPIVVAGGLTEFQTPFGTEYKRLPVRLVLHMDIRQLNYFIAQCGNQSLPVEVKEVRINPLDTVATSGRSAPQAGFVPARGDSTAIETFPSNPHLATVAIQGVIYIFNEPSQEIIQAAQGAGDGLAQN